MGKEFVDYVNLYGKEMEKSEIVKIKLHVLLSLHKEINKLKEKLNTLEKKFGNE